MCVDGYFPLGEKLCIGWATMDVLMCTASIWHMATISVDRYCSLRFPLRYRRTKSPVFVVVKIAFVWIVSVGICSFLAVEALLNPWNVYHDGQCSPAVSEFVIYGSIFAFYVPLLVMFVTYALTVRTLSRNEKTLATTWRHQLYRHSSAAYHLARTPTLHILTVSSSTSGSSRRQSQTSSFPQVDKDATKSQISTAAPYVADLLRENVEDNFNGGQVSDGGDRKALYGALSMPELTLMRQISMIGSLQLVSERARYAVSHPALVGATTTPRQNNNDSNDDSDYDEMRRPLSDDATAFPLGQKNDDATPQRQSATYRRDHVTADVVLPVMVDIERQHINTTTSTVDIHHTSLVDVKTRQNDNVDDDVSSPKETPRDVSPSNPVPVPTVPIEMTRQSSGMVRRFTATVQSRGQSVSDSTERTKRKATRVLGVMFVVFVVLWTPFFVLNLLSAVCPHCVQSVAPSVWTVLVWFLLPAGLRI